MKGRFTTTFNMKDHKGREGNVTATFDYYSHPGQWTLSNGDPGFPPEEDRTLLYFYVNREDSDPEFMTDHYEVEEALYDLDIDELK